MLFSFIFHRMLIVFPFQNRGKEVLGSIFKGTTHATCLHSGGIKVFEEMFARLKNGNVDQSDGSDRRLAARHWMPRSEVRPDGRLLPLHRKEDAQSNPAGDCQCRPKKKAALSPLSRLGVAGGPILAGS